MNDAELDEPIVSSAIEVHERYQNDFNRHGRQGNQSVVSNFKPATQHPSPAFAAAPIGEDNAAYTLPTRWWYASTGFPLISGTFGPMANAFSICALVEKWREQVGPGNIVPDDDGTLIPDPKWLIAVNAVSLVFALIANLSLLLNMAKRLSFSVAQPITIVGFWLSSVLLIALIAVASNDLHAPGVQYQALTQAYYYACFAAGMYQIISFMMCVTVYGAIKEKYSREFNLNVAQRTLMLQTISLLTYLLLGALVFSKVEEWRYLDALYWADVTLLTVGLGDFAPSTHLGRGLLFPYAIGGIVILGLVVSSIRSLVLDRGKKKLSARMTEKIRKRVVKEAAAMQEHKHVRKRHLRQLGTQITSQLATPPREDPLDELERRQAEFEAMRKVQTLSDRRQKWMNLLVSVTSAGVLWFIGALVFWYSEMDQQAWTYYEGMYFAYTSLLTIGYGSPSPVSNAGKPFFVLWSLLAVPTLTILISDMGDTVVKFVKDATIWLGEITILPSDEGSMLERLEYGLHKATFGVRKSSERAEGKNETNSDEDAESTSNTLAPGLVRLFKLNSDNDQNNTRQSHGERVAKDFEESEQRDEAEAERRGDLVARDDHHYRHLLLAQIRRVYSDSTKFKHKKYSYEEWAYFLKLLGENESSSTFHRTSPIKRHGEFQEGEHSVSDSNREGNNDETIRPWSWIGPKSPLMSSTNEPDIILEMLFERLEASLHGINQQPATSGDPEDDQPVGLGIQSHRTPSVTSSKHGESHSAGPTET